MQEEILPFQPNETSALVPHRPTGSDLIPGTASWYWDKTGSVVTFMAMVPQGIFGGLLMDALLRQQHWALRLVADLAIAVTALEGKRRLLRYFNEDDFKNLSHFNIIQQLNPRHWTLTGLADGAFTLVVSGVFGGLAAISFDEIGNLLIAYQLPATNTLAHVVKNRWLQSPFIAASFFSNILGFPNVHRGAMQLLKSGFDYLVEAPRFRQHKALVEHKLEALRLKFKEYAENAEQKPEVFNLLNPLIAGEQGMQLDQNNYGEVVERLRTALQEGHLRGRMLDVSLEQGLQPPKPQTWGEFLAIHGFSVAASVVGAAGLYNFIEMTQRACDMFGISSLFNQLGMSSMPKIFGIMDYTSMSLLAFNAIYSMCLDILGHALYSREPNFHVTSKPTRAAVVTASLVICLLGGTPNVYQAFLAKESIPLEVTALLSSFLIEIYGFYALTSKNANRKAMQNNPRLAIDFQIDQILKQAYNLNGLPREDISELSAMVTAESVPEAAYRGWYQTAYEGVSYVKDKLLNFSVFRQRSAYQGLVQDDGLQLAHENYHQL